MAFYDWNHNGKNDRQDDYLEYMIYQESTKNNNQQYSGDMPTSWAVFLTVITIFVSAGIVGICNLEGAPLVILFIIVASIVGSILATFLG